MFRICTVLFAILLSSLSTFAQYYQEGYFINDEGLRTTCLISEKEWTRDPRTFTYKIGQDNVKSASVKTVKEFGIGNNRYLRFQVQVDKSSSNRDSLKEDSSPEWEQDTLFLSVLVDSKADLFYCKRNGENRFFFRADEGAVTQLVHKLYRTPKTSTQESRVATNNSYKNQLKNDVNCRRYSDERLKSLRYDMSVLTNFFKQQNECWGGDIMSVDVADRETLRIRLTPGVSFAHAEGYAERQKYQDYSPRTAFRFGIEFEYVLPFLRKNLALLVEPAYQSYSSKGKVTKDLSIKYNSFEVAMGARYYFHLGKKSSIYVNGAALLDVPAEYLTSYGEHSFSMKTKSICAAAGLGATLKRFSIETRYYTTRQTNGIATIITPVETIYIPLTNDYQKLSILVGYRIL